MPPRILGDGVSSINDLIFKKNKNKKDPIKDVIISEYLIEFLKRQNYSLDSVLDKDKEIDLLEKIGVSYGGSSRELFYETHPKIINYLEDAAKVVGTSILGFDFIVNDPTKDPDTQHWGIIECNSLPFINLHHFPVEGYSINIAEKIWDLWLK
jgi:cyanophycin synthetase